MSAVLFASFWHYFFGILLFVISLFLILLVLVQRGRGGGLTGALGGMGGQSAFGAKAGDTFTRVTMVTATLWIFVSLAAIKVLGTQDDWGGGGPAPPALTPPGAEAPRDTGLDPADRDALGLDSLGLDDEPAATIPAASPPDTSPPDN
jgi:preprotein translocase subunit SecG